LPKRPERQKMSYLILNLLLYMQQEQF